MSWSRREILQLAAALGAGGVPGMNGAMHTRAIPATGEKLPVVGMGTWRTFDVGDREDAPGERRRLREVLKKLLDAGGRLIDSSPMYGRSEKVIGELLEEGSLPRPFLATKVWTSGRDEGIEQMRSSMKRMWPSGTGRPFDLMQIHNLVDWRTHVPTLRAWKAAGTLRYWGITHYQTSAFEEMERIVRVDKPDFVQLPYSVAVREAEQRLLPVCAEQRVAVLVMRPFEGGSLFRDALKRPLPAWAAEIDCGSWAQVFLKFILGHPAVTCPIPATSNPEHMADDARAGYGRIPDDEMRRRIVAELTR